MRRSVVVYLVALLAVGVVGGCTGETANKASDRLATTDDTSVDSPTSTVAPATTVPVVGGGPTSTVPRAVELVPPTTTGTAAPAVPASTTTTMRTATTTTVVAAPNLTTTSSSPPGVTTTVPPATTTTAAPRTTGSTGKLQEVPSLVIPSQPCSAYLEVAFPAAIDQDNLRVRMEAQGYAMPSPTMFRGNNGSIPDPPERDLQLAQRKIDECAAEIGEAAGGHIKRQSNSSGTRWLVECVKDQLEAAKFRNYQGTTFG